MEKKLLLFISVILSSHLFSQPSIRVFAFEQENLPGTKPAGVTDENGHPVQKAAAKKTYLIFLSLNKAYNITPTQVFIKGKPVKITTTMEKKAPVQYINNNIPAKPEKIILVPATTNKVLELKFNGTTDRYGNAPTLQRLIERNDVVIVYLWKNKKYFLSLKKIKKLEPVANE